MNWKRAGLLASSAVVMLAVGLFVMPAQRAGAQSAPGASAMFAYVGSFTTEKRKARGDGIHVYRVDVASGAWTHVQHVGDLVNPSFLTLSADRRFLYSVHGDENYATAFSLDRTTGEAKLLEHFRM